ncbi:MAG: phenylacetate--CoA ligase family protein [Chloroflexi bacterium]|uniref:phenylacetate--CoA ligase family protein n=1 Tax=Candidatus Flexifilum breve TaxID=3140694 RepID=UPI0031348548|nr:phenylacetate--CoA ligase family protein [Chloroflexota bacterium]
MNFDQRIRDLVAHAYAHAPAVRDRLDQAGVTPADIQSAADLAKIPVLPKDALVDLQRANPPFGGLLTVDPATLPRIYISPGPIFDPQPEPDAENADYALAPFRAVGFGSGDRVLNTFMYHLTPAGLLIDNALRAVGATVIPSGPGNTELQIMLLTSLRATGYVGTPSFLAIILDKAAEMGIPKEAVTIKKALFSAEPYMPGQRARFEGDYSMVTTSAYGTADLGFMGYTKAGVQGFCLTPNIYMQICSPERGEPVEQGHVGEIVVTTFNKSYPLIRFGTGDLGALAPEADPNCDGGQQLLGLFGRSGDAIKVRGMFLHPNQILAAMSRIDAVKTAQAVITRADNRDVVTMRVELKPDHDGGQVEDAVKAYVQSMARLRVDAVDIVPAGSIDPTQRAIKDERKWE